MTKVEVSITQGAWGLCRLAAVQRDRRSKRRPNQISQLETSLSNQGSGTSSTGKVFMSLGSAT